jgi:hypothetical protein
MTPPGHKPGGFVLDDEERARRIMAIVKLPDGSKRADVADGSTVQQVAESIGRGLAKAAVAGRVDGKVVDLSYKLNGRRARSRDLTDRDPDALLVLRHSTAHVMAEAIQRLCLTPNSPTDCARDRLLLRHRARPAHLRQRLFARIEKEWTRSSRRTRPFTRYDLSAAKGWSG